MPIERAAQYLNGAFAVILVLAIPSASDSSDKYKILAAFSLLRPHHLGCNFRHTWRTIQFDYRIG